MTSLLFSLKYLGSMFSKKYFKGRSVSAQNSFPFCLGPFYMSLDPQTTAMFLDHVHLWLLFCMTGLHFWMARSVIMPVFNAVPLEDHRHLICFFRLVLKSSQFHVEKNYSEIAAQSGDTLFLFFGYCIVINLWPFLLLRSFASLTCFYYNTESCYWAVVR